VREANREMPGEIYGTRDDVFGDLMSFRVRDILLVSSAYDSYILEEDGLLGESLDVEYLQLNLSSAPRITRVATGEEALALLNARHFDLVITMARLGEMDVRKFGRMVKERYPHIPVVLLAYSSTEAARLKESEWRAAIDQVFIWRGDFRIFLAIIKYVEDRHNVEPDMTLAGVRVIILIENSVRFYSSYLPMLYMELMRQNQLVMADGVNAKQRIRRMRARPKILLAENFEEGWELFERYRDHVLGIITDARYPREGRADPEAGLEFVRRVKTLDPDMPALIQSSDETLEEKGRSLGAAFLNKRSPRLLEQLRRFIQASLGFGDFVFLMPDGREVTRVEDLAGMAGALVAIPAESLRYHATRNHFSNWCMARTEFELAERIRPVRVSEFENIEMLRGYLIDAFSRLRTDTRRGVVAEFSLREFDATTAFARIGSGSMGGKGRGLGFINALLSRHEMPEDLRGVRIHVPPSVVIGTDVFDEFLRENDLAGLALSDAPDEEIAAAFTQGRFSDSVREDLRVYIRRMREPLAVRSSSILEDSHDQPFAGIYRTYMLANNDPDEDVRCEQLCDAIRLVYASVFFRNAKAYIQNTQHRMEEEKMGVVLQQLVGRQHAGYFYPDISGVACSYNYYPVLETAPEDGVALAALGLGKTVVDGERAVRFSPGRPHSMPQFSSAADFLENAQREFYALDLGRRIGHIHTDADEAIVRLDLEAAEGHGTLGSVASTYSPDNDAVYDGISRQGIRLVTLAPILKTSGFPLPRILAHLLSLGSRLVSCPVEMEFAANLRPSHGGPPEFAFLQIRPMAVEVATANLDDLAGRVAREDLLAASVHALGQGRIRDIVDVVYVRPEMFDRSCTHAVAQEVGIINADLVREGRPYLLIGPGRWGTSDPWLGIPVEWHQIAGTGAIIETDLGETPVTPSEGTHFFQNLTAFGIGYFNIHRHDAESFVDYAWLGAQSILRETTFLRHLRLARPLDIRVDGRSRRGLVLKAEI
jgi:hypothetical protein